MPAMGHERRFREVRDESALPPAPERLRRRNKPTLRATSGRSRFLAPSRLTVALYGSLMKCCTGPKVHFRNTTGCASAGRVDMALITSKPNNKRRFPVLGFCILPFFRCPRQATKNVAENRLQPNHVRGAYCLPGTR
jgi:hypothetical protein